MTELSEQDRRKRRRAGCAWGCGGAFVLVALLFGGLAAYLAYANQVPTVTPTVVSLPNPNARDDCLAAIALLPPDSRRTITDLQEGKEVDLRPIVKAAQPALAKVRASFRHPYLNPPVDSYATFPEYSDFRNLARLFALEGRLAEEEGRYDDAVRSYLDCYRFGSEMQRGGVLITGLVGNAIQAIALAPLDDLAPKLDQATATRTARELARLEAASPSPADCLATEAHFGEAALVEIVRQSRGSYRALQTMGGGSGGAQWDWESVQWGVRYALTPKKQMLEAHRRFMNEYVTIAKRPYGNRGPNPDPPDDPLNTLVLPTLTASIFNWDRNRAASRLVQGKLAARAYSLRHGRMPSKMEDVAPEFIPKAPLDWFGGQPLLVGRLEGRGPIVVYSAGPDMDDDKGRAVPVQLYQNSDGDLVEVRRRRVARSKKPGASRPGTRQ